MMTNDLISREDALNCFHDWVDRRGDVHTADEMPEYRAIEELPSVKPNTAEYGSESCMNAEKMHDRTTDDLISRQAAIDALDSACVKYNISPHYEDKRTDKEKFSDWWDMHKVLAMRLINCLPSAQPIRCGECRYQDKGENESESWNECKYRPWLLIPTHDEHWCSYAERRDDENPG